MQNIQSVRAESGKPSDLYKTSLWWLRNSWVFNKEQGQKDKKAAQEKIFFQNFEVEKELGRRGIKHFAKDALENRNAVSFPD